MTNNTGYEDRITVDKLSFEKLTEEEKQMDYRERRKKYYEDIYKQLDTIKNSEDDDDIEYSEEAHTEAVKELEEMRLGKK